MAQGGAVAAPQAVGGAVAGPNPNFEGETDQL